MKTTRTVLATIGYEAADLVDFVATLRAATITRLIDVRQLAISRRPGFAKTVLSGALAAVGIDYVHLKGLGDPKEGREAARAGNADRFREVYFAHMKTQAAHEDLATAAQLVSRGGACLMCYERDHSTCHRTIVAHAIHDSVPLSIRHLGVRPLGAHHRKQISCALIEERA